MGRKEYVDQILRDYRKVKLHPCGTMGGEFIVISEVISNIWNEASEELKLASKLLSYDETKTENKQSEIDSKPRPSKLKKKGNQDL